MIVIKNKVDKAYNHEPKRKYITLVIIITIFLIIEFIFYYNYFNYRVFVNDKPLMISRFATLHDAIKKSGIKVEPGDFVDIENKVIEKGKGGPIKYFIDFKNVSGKSKVKRMAEIFVVNGIDRMEPQEKIIIQIPFKYNIIGEGPYYEITRKGKLGRKLVNQGIISKKTKDEVILEEKVDCIIIKKRSKKDRMIALTFDDGPHKKYTPQILDILSDKKVRANFFVLGINAERNPELLKRIIKEGHMIANHSFSHTYLTKMNPEQIKGEIERTSQIVKKATGKGTTWLRPPGGSVDQKVINVAQLTKHRIIKWTVDPQDWRQSNHNILVSKIINTNSSGSIILLHDGGGNRQATVKALPTLIDKLLEEGYQLVTVDMMFSK